MHVLMINLFLMWVYSLVNSKKCDKLMYTIGVYSLIESFSR